GAHGARGVARVRLARVVAAVPDAAVASAAPGTGARALAARGGTACRGGLPARRALHHSFELSARELRVLAEELRLRTRVRARVAARAWAHARRPALRGDCRERPAPGLLRLVHAPREDRPFRLRHAHPAFE